MAIGEFGVGRPDFGGRRPRGEALGPPKKYQKRVIHYTVELYLYDRALKSEALKSPSPEREPLKNKCKSLSKIVKNVVQQQQLLC